MHASFCRLSFLRTLRCLLPLCAIFFSSPASATEIEIPESLRPWLGWVQDSIPEYGCSHLGGTLVCAWPGKLDIRAEATGASFRMEIWQERAGKVALPGARGLWPQDVRTGAQKLGVLGEDHPHVYLARGAHMLTGRFIWSELPEIIHVPAQFGIVSLAMDGQPVPYPRHDAEGRLWLKEGRTGTVTEADSLRVSVYRSVSDAIPLAITTRLQLNVSGRAREVSLGTLLIPGSRATLVSGQLPVQIDSSGEVSVYIRPGTHVLEINAVIADPTLTSLTVPERSQDFFDRHEVWIWSPNERLRSVEVDGLAAVDPERTTVPREWVGAGTTYLAEPGQSLQLQETRRGQIDTPPNVVNLQREIWMDLDGQGATSRDRLRGTVNRGWRLDYGEGGELGRAAQAGTDLVITEIDAQKGVELRNASLNLQAEVRLEGRPSHLRIVGWKHDVQQLGATIHTPPGWSLLGGRGVDRIRSAWLSSWNLLDFFFVLIVALSFAKLFGWKWGIVAALGLCLSQDLGDAPRWIWVQLLISLAILRVLSGGRVRRLIVLYRAAVLITLFIVLAVFVQEQIQQATHPQVANIYSHSSSFMDDFTLNAEFLESPLTHAEDLQESGYSPRKESSIEYLSSRAGSSPPREVARKSLQQIDPKAIVQTGPGVPTWTWQKWQLEWTGPVRKDHEVRLWFISPMQNAVIIALRLLLLILLALVIISGKDMFWRGPDEDEEPPPKQPRASKGPANKAVLSGLLAIVLAGTLAEPAQAQEIPSPEMLEALKTRLIAENQCEGPCVSVSHAHIRVDDLDFVMTADVHVQKTAGWSMPGPEDPLRIVEVLVDGRPTTQLRRSPQGLISVRLTPGAHTVQVRGRLINRAVATIQFDPSTRPRHASFESPHWTVDGIDRQGVPDGSLQLTRQQDEHDESAPQADLQASRDLPPWFSVKRDIALAVTWQIRTTVSRAETERPLPYRYPLMEGEAVISEGFRVEDGHVLIDFARDVTSLEFTSEFPIAPDFQLKAPTGAPWTETWTVECSAIWRCTFDGLVTIDTVQEGIFKPRWLPWPGESLKVAVNRPEGASGQATTVESVGYTITPGRRLLTGTLDLQIRSSRGDWQSITLPEGAELQQVSIDGTQTSIRPRDRIVRLPIKPGMQSYRLEWQQPWERAFFEEFPILDIGSEAVNARLQMNLDNERWLLWTRGPAWGPAVLFWSHLLLLLIIAALLGLWKASPLRTYEWLLLTLGLAQLPVAAMVPVVAFFIVFQWRRTQPFDTKWKFDFLQLFLIALTGIALLCLYSAIHTNLLLNVDMQVQGMSSRNDTLIWYIDRIDTLLPAAGVISLPIFVWRGLMLLWALWLSWKILKWLPWAWQSFSTGGLWMPLSLYHSVQTPVTDGSVQGTAPPGPPKNEGDPVV